MLVKKEDLKYKIVVEVEFIFSVLISQGTSNNKRHNNKFVLRTKTDTLTQKKREAATKRQQLQFLPTAKRVTQIAAKKKLFEATTT